MPFTILFPSGYADANNQRLRNKENIKRYSPWAADSSAKPKQNKNIMLLMHNRFCANIRLSHIGEMV